MREEYKFDQSSNHWIQKDELMDRVLEKGVHIRYKISRIKYQNNDFVSVITVIICAGCCGHHSGRLLGDHKALH